MNNVKFNVNLQLVHQYLCGDRGAGEKIYNGVTLEVLYK